MSAHRPTYQCFQALGSGATGAPHGPCPAPSMFPGIPRHHLAHREESGGCCLCADHHHYHHQHQHLHDAPSAAHFLPPIPWYHRPPSNQRPPEHHQHLPPHHAPPQRYAPHRPTGPHDPPGPAAGDECQRHRHRHHHRRRSQNRTTVLVKNSDPAFRRSIALHRGGPGSLELFLEEVSELMQYRVRKLYTQEGHKIDSIQGLLHCPSMLICVGREPSHPAILENLRKTVDGRAPRHARLSSNGFAEEQERLGTKTTANHPRDNTSTNRSSDKPLPDGRNSPEHTNSNPDPGVEDMINDDIEKRVIVNEDGSLSMEMKVRFRLLHDETLQWSTQVLRNSGLRSFEYRQGRRCYLEQSSPEGLSEPESMVSTCEAQEAYITQCYERHMEEAHCTHCCTQCQEYLSRSTQSVPEEPNAGGNVTSSGSLASSHTTVRKRTEVKNTQTMSMSSEEGVGQVVQTETWVETTVSTEDTVEYCTVRSELSPQRYEGGSSVGEGTNNAEGIPESFTLVPTESTRIDGTLSLVSGREERAGSAISVSSMILASLTEDQDDEEDELPTGVSSLDLSAQKGFPRPPSKGSGSSANSQRSKNILRSSTPGREISSPLSTTSLSSKTKCKCVTLDEPTRNASGSNSPTSTISSGDKFNKDGQPQCPKSTMLEEGQQMDEVLDKEESTEEEVGDRTSKVSELPPGQRDPSNRASSQLSQRSGASVRSNRSKNESPDEQDTLKDENDVITQCGSSERSSQSQNAEEETRPPSTTSGTSMDVDKRDTATDSISNAERIASAMSGKSVQSNRHTDNKSTVFTDPLVDEETAKETEEHQMEDERVSPAMSCKSAKSHVSARLMKLKPSEFQADITSDDNEEPMVRASSKLSAKSTKSAKKESDDILDDETPQVESPDRAKSSMSTKSARSNTSAMSRKSKRSQVPSEHRTPASTISTKLVESSAMLTDAPDEEIVHDENAEDVREDTASCCMSLKSTKSTRSNVSAISKKSKCAEVAAVESGDISADDNAVEESVEPENSSASSISQKSGKSNISAVSKISKCSTVLSEKSVEISDEIKTEEGSVSSVRSARSHVSRRSRTSKTPVALSLESSSEDEGNIERPASSTSGKSVNTHVSEISKKSNACEAEERAQSVLSAKSTMTDISRTSRISAVKSEITKVKDDIEERAPSTMSLKSTKSNVSSRLKKYKNTDTTEEIVDLQEIEARPPSSRSSKSIKSAKSNDPAEFNEFRVSGDLTVNDGDVPEQSSIAEETSERAASAMSAKSIRSNVSARSRKSEAQTVNGDLLDRGPGENGIEGRASSAAKSNISRTSRISKVSVKKPELETGERAPSGMSAKSTRSRRSAKSKTSREPGAPSEGNTACPAGYDSDDEPEAAGRGSAISAKSNFSVKSGISKSSCVPPEVHAIDDEEAQERAASTLSEITPDVSGEQNSPEADRAPSGMSESARSYVASTKSKKSVKSNASAIMKKSKATEVPSEKLFELTADTEGEIKERAERSSHISSRTNNSVQNSTVIVDDERSGGENEHQPMNNKAESCKSFKSNKSKQGDVSNINDTEDRASTKSTTSRVSVSFIESKSNDAEELHPTDNEDFEGRPLSNMSIKSEKSNGRAVSAYSKVSKAEDGADSLDGCPVEQEAEDRAMSNVSERSAKSGISAKSMGSKASGVQSERPSSVRSKKSNVKTTFEESDIAKCPAAPIVIVQETSENDADERTPSAMSLKSVKSAKSNLSTRSTKSKVSDVPNKACSNEQEEPQTRAKSSLSVKSAKSVKSTSSTVSRKSKVSNSPGDIDNEESAVVKAESTRSAKSANTNISVKSAKSVASTASAVSNKPKVSEHPVENGDDINIEGPAEEEFLDRAASAMSAKSNISKESKASKSAKSTAYAASTKCEVCQCPSEVSVVIQDGHIEEHTTKRSQSSMSAKSAKSNLSGKLGTTMVSPVTLERSERFIADEGRNEEDSAIRVASAQSNKTAKSNISKKQSSNVSAQPTEINISLDIEAQQRPSGLQSVKSAKSTTSAVSTKNMVLQCESDVVDEIITADEADKSGISLKSSTISFVNIENAPERSTSDTSAKSNISACTHISKVSKHALNLEDQERPEMSSAVKSNRSVRSKKSRISDTPKAKTKPLPIPQDSSKDDSDMSQSLPSDIGDEKYETFQADSQSNSNVFNKTHMPDNKSDISSKCRHKRGNHLSQSMIDLVPSKLPNASPTEVVSEWLKNIPADNVMYDNVDEYDSNSEGHERAELTEGSMGEMANAQTSAAEDVNNPEKANGLLPSRVSESSDQSNTSKAEDTCNCDRTDDTTKVFHSSVQVMKVLLGPRTDRCNSLPEMSPVYGRKLSTSARGLLDCLVKLQLIEFDPANETAKDQKYRELMNILQSLWLCEPSQNKQMVTGNGQPYLEEDLHHTSSSGVDVNSGSPGSGNSSVNSGVQTNGNVELQPLLKVQEVNEAIDEASVETTAMASNEPSQNIQRDTQFTPDGMMEKTTDIDQKEEEPRSDETISIDSPRELAETPQSSGTTSSSGNYKKDCQEDNTSSTFERLELTMKMSQDPDPMWLLNLLNKLQKQFMKHYVNAMTEFKVHWNLSDNEEVDRMISDLKCQVRKRIQASIDRELRKTLGQGGQATPGKEAVSCNSSEKTERGKRLMTRQKESSDAQKGGYDDDCKAGTSYSDQRSENEDCPCESCKEKTNVLQPPILDESMHVGPVCTDFDIPNLNLENDTSNVHIILTANSDDADESMAENKAAQMFVENVIIDAVREVKCNGCEKPAEETFETDDAEEIKGVDETAEGETSEKETAEELVIEEQPAEEQLYENHITEDKSASEPSEKDNDYEIVAEDETAEQELADEIKAMDDSVLEEISKDTTEEIKGADETSEMDSAKDAMLENGTAETETSEKDNAYEVIVGSGCEEEEEKSEQGPTEDIMAGETHISEEDLSVELKAKSAEAEILAEVKEPEQEPSEISTAEDETAQELTSEKDPAEEIISERETKDAEISENRQPNNCENETGEDETSGDVNEDESALEETSEKDSAEDNVAEVEIAEEGTSEKDNNGENKNEFGEEEETTEQDNSKYNMAGDDTADEDMSESEEDTTSAGETSEKDPSEDTMAEDESVEEETSQKDLEEENMTEAEFAEETAEKDPVEEIKAEAESVEEEESDKDIAEEIVAETESLEEETAGKDIAEKVVAETESAEEETSKKDPQEEIMAEDESAEEESSEKDPEEENMGETEFAEETSEKDPVEEIKAEAESAEEETSDEDTAEESETESAEEETSEKDPASETMSEVETEEYKTYFKDHDKYSMAREDSADEEKSENNNSEEESKEQTSKKNTVEEVLVEEETSGAELLEKKHSEEIMSEDESGEESDVINTSGTESAGKGETAGEESNPESGSWDDETCREEEHELNQTPSIQTEQDIEEIQEDPKEGDASEGPESIDEEEHILENNESLQEHDDNTTEDAHFLTKESMEINVEPSQATGLQDEQSVDETADEELGLGGSEAAQTVETKSSEEPMELGTTENMDEGEIAGEEPDDVDNETDESNRPEASETTGEDSDDQDGEEGSSSEALSAIEEIGEVETSAQEEEEATDMVNESTEDEVQHLTEEHDGEEPKDEHSHIYVEGEEDEKADDATDGQDDLVGLKSVLMSDTEDLVEDISVNNMHRSNEMDMQLEEMDDDNINETEHNLAPSDGTIIGNVCQDESKVPTQASVMEEDGEQIENQGNSADDEAEDEDSDDQEGQETDEAEKEVVSTKLNGEEDDDKVAEVKALRSLQAFVNVRAESESGAYADVEESDTEGNNGGDGLNSERVGKIPSDIDS